MKATLLANGFMKISAESSVESYALRHWWLALGELTNSGSGICVDFEFPEDEGASPLPIDQIK